MKANLGNAWVMKRDSFISRKKPQRRLGAPLQFFFGVKG